MSSKLAITLRALPVVLLACILPVVAHKHHDALSEEQANAPVDAILWIHIFLQAIVWGFLFPIGMVLGLSRSKWHVPLQVRPLVLNFGSQVSLITMAHSELWICLHYWRLYPRTFTQGSLIPRGTSRDHGQHHVHPYHPPVDSRNLPQTSHTRADSTAVCCHRAWCRWKDVSRPRLGTDAFRSDHVPRLLSWWKSRAMSCALHYGKHASTGFFVRLLEFDEGERFHCVRYNHGYHVVGGRGMGSTEWA